jgi:hypothetical protein
MVRMGTNAEEAGRWAIRMGYGSAKEMDDDFTSRSAWGDKKTQKAKVTRRNWGLVNLKKNDEIEN